MRFNIAKLREAGFRVDVDKDTVEIQGPPLTETAWLNIRAVVTGQAKIKDPGLQDYVLGEFMTALHRAQILELAE